MTSNRTYFLLNQFSKWRLSLAFVAISCSFLAIPHLEAQNDWLQLDAGVQPDRYTIKFNDVAATEFINFVSRISNKNFIYDSSQLNFKITIVSDEPASAEEVLSTLIQIMRLNKLQVTEEGSNLLIYKSEKDSASILSQVSDENSKKAIGLTTKVFKLKYASVPLVQEVVTKLATDSSRVASHEPTRHLIVSDTSGNVERIGQLILALDQIDSTQDIEVYKVKHANLSALKSFAEQIIAPLNSKDSVTLIPNMAANSLFIIGSRQSIDRSLNILTVLDVPSELEIISKSREKKFSSGQLSYGHADVLDSQINPEFFIYKLQFHKGEVIMRSLKEISTNMTALNSDRAIDPKLVNAMQTIQWLETTNSLIFSGDDATLIKLRNLIQSLDTPVKQVFIEALIIDTSIGKASEFKVDVGSNFTWKDGRLGVALGNYRSGSNLANDIKGNHSTRSYAPPTISATDFSLGVIGSAISHQGINYATMGTLLRAVQSDADTRIILNPKIITEDNVPCEFFVGQQTRVKTGSVQNSGNNNVTSSNFEIMDIGTLLKIVPTISNDELITLVIEQETSNSLNSGDATDTTALVPLTKTSRTKTRLHVPDRHFVILSGMIDESITDIRSKVPLLGDIPVLGFLFRSKEKTRSRRNLLFFIRPHIIKTPEEARLVTQRHKDILIKQKFLPKDFDEQLNFTKELPVK
jgi:type III secretion protein C